MALQLSANRLLSWAMGITAAYWSIGFLANPLWYSVVISACLFVGGVMVFARVVPEAISIVRKDEIGSGELSVIALALISTGAVWSGGFNILYAHCGRPEEWIGPISSAGRAMIAVGFFVLFLSPDTTRGRIAWPRWYVLLSFGIMIATVAFILGYTLNASHIQSMMSDFMAVTPKMTDIMVVRVT